MESKNEQFQIFNFTGAVVGSNFVGALLDGNCDTIFIANSSLLLGDFINSSFTFRITKLKF